MRRMIYLILLFFVTYNGYSQTPDFPIGPDGEILFSNVVNVDSVNALQLYNKTKDFLVKTFISYKNVVQIDDPQSGIILIKPIFDVYGHIVGKTKIGYVEYTLKILFKDGRYKYEMSNFRHVEPKLSTPGNLLSKAPTEDKDVILHYEWEYIQKQTFNYADKLIKLLNEHIMKVEKNENW